MSTVFKIGAWLVILGGGITAIESASTLHHSGATGRNVAAVVVGIVAGSIFAAAALSCFAYVLDLVIDIEWNTFPTQ